MCIISFTESQQNNGSSTDKSDFTFENTAFVILFVVLSLLFMVITVLVLCRIRSCRKKSKHKYIGTNIEGGIEMHHVQVPSSTDHCVVLDVEPLSQPTSTE